MALVSKRLKGPGLYIFDEPEAALSPSRQMAALVRIHELVKKGAQFIIATHSPILIGLPERPDLSARR
jgi:predicted ATPase